MRALIRLCFRRPVAVSSVTALLVVLSVVASLLASLLVALTVVPLIVRNDARPDAPEEEPDAEHGATRLPRLLAAYERALEGCLNRPGRVLAGALILLVGAGALDWTLPREVVPSADQGRVEAHLTMAPGTDLPVVEERANAVAQRARRVAGATHVLGDLGERSTARLELDPRPPYEADLTLMLPDSVRAQTAARRLQQTSFPSDATVEVRPAQTRLGALLSPAKSDLLIDLRAEERRQTRSVVDTLLQRLRAHPELAGVRWSALWPTWPRDRGFPTPWRPCEAACRPPCRPACTARWAGRIGRSARACGPWGGASC